MTYKTYKVKTFVKNFYFPNPSWKDLPSDFPNLSKEGLTREERHLLDAIILAWQATQPKGKMMLYKTYVKLGFFVSLVLFFGFISLKFLISNSQIEFTKTVQAVTLQVDEIIQSTVSAILRK